MHLFVSIVTNEDHCKKWFRSGPRFYLVSRTAQSNNKARDALLFYEQLDISEDLAKTDYGARRHMTSQGLFPGQLKTTQNWSKTKFVAARLLLLA
jgi:hypothetical protein